MDIEKELSDYLNKSLKKRGKNIEINDHIRRSFYKFISEKMQPYVNAYHNEQKDVQRAVIDKLSEALPHNGQKPLRDYMEFGIKRENDLMSATLMNTVDFMVNYRDEISNVLSVYYNFNSNLEQEC